MSVTPKVHIIEDHAIEQFERLQGFGDFTEDYIEQAHQWGEIEERRTHGLRDRTKAANAHSKWEFMRLNPLVVKEVTTVAEGAKRKFRRDANGRTKKEAQMDLALTAKLSRRAELRADDREVVDLPSRLLSAEDSEKLDCKIAHSVI